MQFLVTIHRIDGYDGASESAEMVAEIDELNHEMSRAGARLFAGGFGPVEQARSLRAVADGSVEVSEGCYLPGAEHAGGCWLLECPSLEEAVAWGKKAVAACRANVEVRPFLQAPA